MNWSELVGKKILCFRGYTAARSNYSRKKTTPLEFILFSDKKTFIELSEQDYFDFHDCSKFARHLYLQQNAERWKQLFDGKDKKGKAFYNEPDEDQLKNFPF